MDPSASPNLSEREAVRTFLRRLRRIIQHNVNGVAIKEVYASILLSRILSSFPTGFVDLQSPLGIGLSVMVYNYDGDVYPSDEARMLAEMGDKRFRLGSVPPHTMKPIDGCPRLEPR